jgi:acylglycerol lipase
MTLNEFEFQVAGKTLHGQYYSPKTTHAVIVLVHGLGEHSKRYEREVVPALLNNSMAVISYDQFGHGQSKGKRGYHPGFSFLLDSIDQMIQKSSELFHEKPVFLYGHSMGGNIAINYSLRRSSILKGLVITSPFLQIAFEPPQWKMAFAKIIDKIMPSLTMPSDLDVTAISRDKDEIAAYQLDPLVHDRVSTGYSLEIMKNGEWAIEHANDLKIPMLLLHGTKDRLTSYVASEEFAKKSGQVQLMLFENAYHELHHDLDKDKALEKIINWIKDELQLTK